jgi:hypothetical protein
MENFGGADFSEVLTKRRNSDMRPETMLSLGAANWLEFAMTGASPAGWRVGDASRSKQAS